MSVDSLGAEGLTVRTFQSRRATKLLAFASILALTAGACSSSEVAEGDQASESPSDSATTTPTVDPGSTEPDSDGSDVDPDLLMKALGTDDVSGVPEVVLAGIERAGRPLTPELIDTALTCWQEKECDTGTGGDVSVALADGFGENVWREVTHMEFILQALTYPEIGEIVYTSAQGDTQKAISDFRALIAREMDVIVTFADAGEALLPTVREATNQGVTVVPYISAPGGTPGEDYLAFVAEDLCQLGENFADVLNTEVGSGKVAFLGGTPGNPLSEAWQSCAEPALVDELEVVGKADTNWTQEGTLQAVSGLLSEHPDLAGISYEYADGFLGAIRAYEAADVPLDVVLTLRTDEAGVFCAWEERENPDFKIFFSSGGSFDSAFALTAGMKSLAGEDVDPEIIVPAQMRQVDESHCNRSLPLEAPASTLVPDEVLTAMYAE